jgi:hypothetical protein
VTVVSVHSFAKEIQLNDTGDVAAHFNIINGMRISPGPAAAPPSDRAPDRGISYYTCMDPSPGTDDIYTYIKPIKANAHGSKPRAVKPYCYMPSKGTLVQNAAVGDQRLAWHVLATLHPPTLSTRSG